MNSQRNGGFGTDDGWDNKVHNFCINAMLVLATPITLISILAIAMKLEEAYRNHWTFVQMINK